MKKPKIKEITDKLGEEMFQMQLTTGCSGQDIATFYQLSLSAVNRAISRRLMVYQQNKRQAQQNIRREFEMF